MEIFFVRHAQTQMNVEKRQYDNFGKDEYYPITERGKIQAQETGKYLKTYGKFDLVISSPRHRCLETAEEINKIINFNGKIIESNLLLEGKSGKFNGMKFEDVSKLLEKDKNIININKKINKETNIFNKIKLYRKQKKIYKKFLQIPNSDELIKNYKKFLNKLTKIKKAKRILIVCHSGTIDMIQRIITNTDNYSFDYNIVLNEYNNGNKKMYENSACFILTCLLDKTGYHLVSPKNNLHLENIQEKK